MLKIEIKKGEIMSHIINYGKHYIDNDDIKAVEKVLRSDWLTQGPKVDEFENRLSNFTGYDYCKVCNSGTAALHVALEVANINSYNEVITSPLSFVATAAVIKYTGAKLTFCDIDKNTGLIDIESLKKCIKESRPKAIIGVDYAGQQCDYKSLRKICDEFNIILISDACHSFGAVRKELKNDIADITCYSFHPVKHITTGEGGAILFNEYGYYMQARRLINHGRLTNGLTSLTSHNPESLRIGFNYRMPDINAALGLSQLGKIDKKIKRLQEIANKYNSNIDSKYQLNQRYRNMRHLYILKVDNRSYFIKEMLKYNIKCAVHYDPIYNHHAFCEYKNESMKKCLNMEAIKDKLVTIPLHYSLSDLDVKYIIDKVNICLKGGK
jgi:perosamine synthetase